MSESPLSKRLVDFGAIFTPCIVQPGQPYWKLVRADGPLDLGGNHHLYVEVLDEAGKRAVGARVLFYSQNEKWPTMTEAKPGEPYSANLPLYAGGHAYGVIMGDNLPSDSMFGVGLGDHVPHQSFTAIFMRAIRGGSVIGTGPQEPPQPSKIELRIDGVWYDAIKRP